MTTAFKPKLTAPEGHLEPITCVAFSQDGDYILTGSEDKTAKVWDGKGRMLRTIRGFTQTITSVSFSNDDELILIGSSEQIFIYEAESGMLVNQFDLGGKAAFHPNGKKVAIASGANGIIIFPLEEEATTLEIPYFTEECIQEIKFSPDSTCILSIDNQATKLNLWNTEGGTLRKEINLKKESIHSASFSKNSQLLAIGTDRRLLVWDLNADKIISRKPGGTKQVQFTKKVLWRAKEDGEIQAFDIEKFKPQGKPFPTSNNWESALFSVSGEKLALWKYEKKETELPYVAIWDTSQKEKLLNIQGHAHSIIASALSDDSTVLTVATKKKLKVWHLCNNQLVQNIEITEPIESLDITHDGHKIVGGMKNGFMQIWDSKTCEPFCHPYKGNNGNINQIKIAGNGSLGIAGFRDPYAGQDDYAVLMEGDKGQTIKALSCGAIHGVTLSVDISPDGSKALTGLSDGTIRVWDTKTGKQLFAPLKGHNKGVHAVAFSRDVSCSKILSGTGDGQIKLWDSKTGKQIGKEMQAEEFKNKKVESVAFSPNHDIFISGNFKDRSFGVWDAQSYKLLHLLKGHDFACKTYKTCSSFNKNGSMLFTSAGDSRIIIWDTHSGKEIAHLYVLNENDWAVITQDGRFDASTGGMNLLYYVVGLETIGLEQLKARYYEPGLLAKLIGICKEELPDISNLDKVELFPRINAEIRDKKLYIDLEERNGGIGKVCVFVNQKEILKDANPERKTQLDPLDLTEPRFAKFYLPGDRPNVISIRSYNAEGWLKSRAHELVFTADFTLSKGIGRRLLKKKRRKREALGLYALFVGTSDYKFKTLSLTFPDKDAHSMYTAINLVGEKLFKQKIESTLLNTDPDLSNIIPTKENIKQQIDAIAQKAKPLDTVLLFLSGHGVTREDQFYYLTRNMPTDQLTDPAIRKKYTISSDELTEWLNTIPAARQVLIVDSCDSGFLTDTYQTKSRSLNASQIKALDRMKDRTGMFILTGSAGDKESFESSRFGQGLLTYSLLLGMSGAALKEGEGDISFVDIMKLFQFSVDEVPKLARQINREQQPQVIGNAGFDIGIVDEKTDIPLPAAKPVFMRSMFMQEEIFNDPLDLSDTFDDYCQNNTDEVPALDVLFFNVNKFEEGYCVKGMYTVNRGKVKVRCRLFKDHEPLGRKVNVKGKKDNIPLLADDIMKAVMKWVE